MASSRRSRPSRPLGIWLLCAFFLFGTLVSLGTSLALLFPDSLFHGFWRMKPQARLDFEAMGNGAFALLLPVGMACGFATAGSWLGRRWGRWLAASILALNVLGDLANAVLRSDARTLIGVPIGGALIAYLLMSKRLQRFFDRSGPRGGVE